MPPISPRRDSCRIASVDKDKCIALEIEFAGARTARSNYSADSTSKSKSAVSASGQLQLVAYVTLNDDSSADADALLAHLRGRVPTYLLPAAIAVLPELPR